ncbi:hypothetical protein Tco_0385318 [Tanacetum coccineum]
MNYLKTCSMNWGKSTQFIQITSYLLQVEKISKMKIHYSRLPPKQVYAPCIVDWTILNTMGCAETIEEMLKIKVIEMGGNEKVFSFKAWRRGVDIGSRFYRLCLESFLHLSLIRKWLEEGVEVYFQGGLQNDDYFDANEYWVRISGEDQLRLYRSATLKLGLWLMSMFKDRNHEKYTNVAWVIAKLVKRKGSVFSVGLWMLPTLKELDSNDRRLIIEDKPHWYAGVFEYMAGHYEVEKREVKYYKAVRIPVRRLSLSFVRNIAEFVAHNAHIKYRSLDATTFRELIGPDGRLIVEDPTPSVPRFAIPRPPRLTLQDLSDSIGRMEIRHGVLERMSRRQSYHSDRLKKRKVKYDKAVRIPVRRLSLSFIRNFAEFVAFIQ